MRNRWIVLLALMFSIVACKDGKGSAGSEGATPATPPAATPPKAATPAPAPKAEPKKAAPKEMSAADFFKDYSSLKGMELLDKYRDGVTVEGTIKRIGEEMDKSKFVWVDVSAKNWLSLKFNDKGASLKAKKGEKLKAKCKVGGSAGAYIMLHSCDIL